MSHYECKGCLQPYAFCTCAELDTKEKKTGSAMEQQVGGSHYSKLAIQPMEYSIKNNLDALQHTMVKYATRHKDKNGVEDLKKIIHTAKLAAFMQYGVEL